MVNELKEIRKKTGLTQTEASKLLGISLRSYQTYENDASCVGSIKYNYMLNALREMAIVDEEHGILSLDEIKELCSKVFDEHDVEFCILFGSYAKGTAVETSDVDLVIASSVKGLRFFGLVEELRSALNKKVDLINFEQLNNNQDLLHDVLKEGIRIYG